MPGRLTLKLRWCCHAQDEGFRIANLLHLMQLSNPLSEKSLQMGELCLKCCYCNKWFWVCCWIWSKHIFSIQHLVNFQYKLTPFDNKIYSKFCHLEVFERLRLKFLKKNIFYQLHSLRRLQKNICLRVLVNHENLWRTPFFI